MTFKPCRRVSQALVLAFGTATFASACGGSSSSSSAVSGDASTDSSSTGADGGSSNPGTDNDTSTPDDGGGTIVTEGGSNPIVDAGDDGGGDTASDGGACNAVVDSSPSITSTCSSLEPILGGGELVAGTYYLTAVTTYATAAFCKGGFVPVGFKETAELTVNGDIGTFDSVLQLAATKERRSTSNLTPGANNASPLAVQTTCPAASGTTSVPYEVRVNAGKTELILRLPYAKDAADYTLQLQ